MSKYKVFIGLKDLLDKWLQSCLTRNLSWLGRKLIIGNNKKLASPSSNTIGNFNHNLKIWSPQTRINHLKRQPAQTTPATLGLIANGNLTKFFGFPLATTIEDKGMGCWKKNQIWSRIFLLRIFQLCKLTIDRSHDTQQASKQMILACWELRVWVGKDVREETREWLQRIP